ncbi:alpha/beta hydrolase [Corynebacterium sp.]|uniref:RBBP9/YdeN family alpha/beta hydrolase n=1 Tax=Corynebacterium sp. TaxID=1720 RepID=UPI0027B935BA|nr:alpha/beta fold hydrolase [Corynebacterium sp.]
MHFFIVHGYQAGPEKHWFPWLERQLNAAGHTVHTVALPTPHTPQLSAWVDTLSADIGRPDGDTCIITHSLGGIAALHYLTALEGEWELPGLFIVSGFVEKLRVIPELDEFIDHARVDLPRIAARTGHVEVFFSDNDALVDPDLTQELGQALAATPIRVRGGRHFLESDGYTEFPVLHERIEQWVGSF